MNTQQSCKIDTSTMTAEPFARAFMACPVDDLAVKTAAGLLGAAQEMPLYLDADSGLPEASMAGKMNVYFTFGSGIAVDEAGLDELAGEHPEWSDAILQMKNYFAPLQTGRQIMAAFTPAQRHMIEDDVLWGGTWLGHALPDFTLVAREGTKALRAKCEAYRHKNPGKDSFYDAILITLDAIDTLGGRIYDMACLLDAPGALRAKEAFARAPAFPAQDFYAASALFTLLFSLDGVDSPGHFDQYMIDFWRASDPDEARATLDALWAYFRRVRAWNLCISGSDEAGNDLTNELSYEILKLATRTRYVTPNLTMRCHVGTPQALLEAAAECIGQGSGLPALYNDAAVCPALMRLGIPAADAHRYAMNGCNQIDIQGKSHMGLEDGEVNFAMALELALYDGHCGRNHRLYGQRTGAPDDFDTFDAFMSAVLTQLEFLTRTATGMANRSQELLSRVSPNPLRSLMVVGCMEKGLDYKNSGPLYGHGQILAEGIADTADSLAAIKRYVYEEKRFSLATLVHALREDFAGNAQMETLLKNSPWRYGNDIDWVDEIAAKLTTFFNELLLTIPTHRGGVYGGGCSPFNRAAKYGLSCGALPNGKKKGQPLFADSIGATPGRDTLGPTALINSCLKNDHTLPTSGFILNLKFDGSLFNSKKGRESFLALVKTYFAAKGQMLTGTVVKKDDLLDAQRHPENHGDLIVRIGGYSDYFVNIPPELQENVIRRTQLSL